MDRFVFSAEISNRCSQILSRITYHMCQIDLSNCTTKIPWVNCFTFVILLSLLWHIFISFGKNQIIDFGFLSLLFQYFAVFPMF